MKSLDNVLTDPTTGSIVVVDGWIAQLIDEGASQAAQSSASSRTSIGSISSFTPSIVGPRYTVSKIFPFKFICDVPATWADAGELVRDTGFQPDTPIETGVQRFVDWYLDYYQCRKFIKA